MASWTYISIDHLSGADLEVVARRTGTPFGAALLEKSAAVEACSAEYVADRPARPVTIEPREVDRRLASGQSHNVERERELRAREHPSTTPFGVSSGPSK